MFNYTPLLSKQHDLRYHSWPKYKCQILHTSNSNCDVWLFCINKNKYCINLEQSDLVHTIGESAALGAAGVVLWGSSEYARSQRNCLTVKKYIDGPLGHYVINVTSAAKLCSKALCKKNGKCIRKSLESGAYLHLNPRFFNIRLNHSIRGPRFHVSGHLNNHDILDMKQKFTCQCYQGWTGIYCEIPQITQPVPSHPRDSILGELLLVLSLHFSCLSVIMFLGLCLIIKCLIL